MLLIFCILVLYAEILIFFSSNSLVEFWGFSIYNIMPSANRENFTSPFQILKFLLLIFSFSCLIALARTFSTILNKSGKS